MQNSERVSRRGESRARRRLLFFFFFSFPVVVPHTLTKVTSTGPLRHPSVAPQTSTLRGYAIRPHEFQNNTRCLRNTREHLREGAKPNIAYICVCTCAHVYTPVVMYECNFSENQTQDGRRARKICRLSYCRVN